MPKSFLDLACGDRFVRVESSLAEMSRPRVHVAAFTVVGEGAPLLTIDRVAGLSGTHVEGPLGKCTATLEGEVLCADVADGQFLGELVMRLGWYVATSRLGGVLIHASAVAAGENVLVACGKSGDGKSTLARLSVAAGLRLLTDEVVQLFPDGRVGGTPFRSDEDNVGSPGVGRARYFVALEKAQHEELKALTPLAAANLAMAQCFDVDAFAMPRIEVKQRLLAFLASTQLRTLAFRKHPDAGAFVKGALG